MLRSKTNRNQYPSTSTWIWSTSSCYLLVEKVQRTMWFPVSASQDDNLNVDRYTFTCNMQMQMQTLAILHECLTGWQEPHLLLDFVHAGRPADWECYMNKNKVLVVMLLSEVIRKFHPIDGYLATQHTIWILPYDINLKQKAYLQQSGVE